MYVYIPDSEHAAGDDIRLLGHLEAPRHLRVHVPHRLQSTICFSSSNLRKHIASLGWS